MASKVSEAARSNSSNLGPRPVDGLNGEREEKKNGSERGVRNMTIINHSKP